MSKNFEIIIRQPFESEMDQVYLAGFDTWADKISNDEYLQDCRSSTKYKQGEWWIADCDGRVGSSLITYRNVFGLAPGCMGIGSVATPPEFRGRGRASHLIKQVLEMKENALDVAVFLFSEVKPEFYEKLGFVVLPTDLQKYPDSKCMVNCSRETLIAIKSGQVQTPRYF